MIKTKMTGKYDISYKGHDADSCSDCSGYRFHAYEEEDFDRYEALMSEAPVPLRFGDRHRMMGNILLRIRSIEGRDHYAREIRPWNPGGKGWGERDSYYRKRDTREPYYYKNYKRRGE